MKVRGSLTCSILSINTSKVYLPALEGYVPDDMVQCIGAFLNFYYLARRSSHNNQTLHEMEQALNRFHSLHSVFIDVGICPDGFTLLRQHALEHFIDGIRLFGAPNGVCTSIVESKHIRAIKRPY